MDKTYTPGPFKLVGVSTHPINEGEQIAFIQTPGLCLDLSCVEGQNMNREEFTKIAALFASAPELLEALELLVHYHLCEQEGISAGQPTSIQWLEAVDKASEAINKAKGVSNG